MKQLKIYITLLLTLLLCGCNSTEEPEMGNGEAIKVKLILNDDAASRGPALVLKEYPNMFLHFKGTDATATATYSEAGNTYNIISGASKLTKGSGTCIVICTGAGVKCYKPYGENGFEFFDFGTYLIVCDTQANWTFDGNELTLRTYLKPMFQRLRFVSDSPVQLQYKGPHTYTSLVFNKNGMKETSPHYGCTCKTVDISQKGEDGQYYSEYIPVNGMGCSYYHYYRSTESSPYSPDKTCIAHDYLYIYNPLEPTYCYRKKLPKFTTGDAILVRYPVNLQNGWQQIANKIRTFGGTTLYVTGNSLKLQGQIGSYTIYSADSENYGINQSEVGACINFDYSRSSGLANKTVALINTDSSFYKRENGSYSATIREGPIRLSLLWDSNAGTSSKPSSSDWAKVVLQSTSYFPIYEYIGYR